MLLLVTKFNYYAATTSRVAKTSLFLKRLQVFPKFAALISTRLKGAMSCYLLSFSKG